MLCLPKLLVSLASVGCDPTGRSTRTSDIGGQWYLWLEEHPQTSTWNQRPSSRGCQSARRQGWKEGENKACFGIWNVYSNQYVHHQLWYHVSFHQVSGSADGGGKPAPQVIQITYPNIHEFEKVPKYMKGEREKF